MRLGPGRARRTGELYFVSLHERGEAFRGQRQGREFISRLPQKPQPDEFTPDQFPIRVTYFPSNSVSREFLVIPFSHVIGILTGEHIGDLIHAKIEAALLSNPINTGQELLGRKGAVVSFTRRQAIIASPAVFD